MYLWLLIILLLVISIVVDFKRLKKEQRETPKENRDFTWIIKK